ncbi:protein SHORT INTERNODES-like [Punica granatum]|uniref:Uncharacterized protein n=2 Tax=Punica granatum TaxID=22663 RepID=A0A218XVG5_PUNGR|nr:protein SHORT INTERNODES-like [Punica granatum]OWM88850.1 hypothetical protein CDL15_Pgr020804 [Punica granatum]PKI54802.1 hypothetical protein CRG98_024816 [Punica granatum]
MAGFFSLGGGGGCGGRPPSSDHTHRRPEDDDNPTPNPTETWFWPYGSRAAAAAAAQSHQQHEHEHEQWIQQQQGEGEGGFVTVRQEAAHQQQHHQVGWGPGPGPSSRPSWMNASDESSSRSTGSARGGVSCLDCGNQAKKDCAHTRCRTCCKSRGFHCPTHVKSTWVSAAKRRERHQQHFGALKHEHDPLHFRHGSGASSSGAGLLEPPKRVRENPSSGLLATTSAGLELGNFPAELTSTALFRCVRVSPTDDPQEHYAYQTAVTIGGHVFRGILYDRGPESTYVGGGESSSGGGSGSGVAAQPHNLVTVAATAAENSGMPPSATALYDPNSSIYTAAPLNPYMGTQFFPHQRS